MKGQGVSEIERASEPVALSQVAENATYRQLVSERSRLSWILTIIMLAIFFGYILLIAFDRSFLARPIGSGTTTLGIPMGIGVILAGIVLTWIYVARANRRFDALTRELLEEVGK
jgi:uncharacterized membrane protein (DUF485 family)